MDRLRHFASLSFGRTTGALCAAVLGAERGFAREVSRLARHGHGFAFSQPSAERWFGDVLELDIAPAQAATFLYDWLTDGVSRFHVDRYFLGAGNWAPILRPMSENPIVREAREIHAAGGVYRGTQVYERYLAGVAAGEPIRRNGVALGSESMVNAYFDAFIRLFESIAARGVVRRSALRGSRWAVRHHARRLWSEAIERDVGVAVDAGGQLSKLPGGQHRMAVSLALGLGSIPVQVRLVHVSWVEHLLHVTQLPLGGALVRGLQALPATVRDVPPR